MEQAQTEQGRSRYGPQTTRIVGELPPLDEPVPPAPTGPEQLEVTQPYIPAIHAEPPAFLQRLNSPQTPEQNPAASSPSPPSRDSQSQPRLRPEPVEPWPETEHAPLGHAEPVTEPAPPAAETQPQPAPASTAAARPEAAPRPRPRRSLARRVIRRIIGPDLLRKDPPQKK